jgi:hypothetical protein
MDLLKMIAELRDERSAVDEAIIVLEKLARTHTKRRGRPPAWLPMVQAARGTGTRRAFTSETRKRMAEAQKKRWAAYRKAKAAGESK